jgi:hypothetical protein
MYKRVLIPLAARGWRRASSRSSFRSRGRSIWKSCWSV